MAIYRYHQFDNTIQYYTGAGCLVCGSNVGPCIDLGVVDQIDGAIALCENHARECGVFAGMVPVEHLDEIRAEANDKLREARRFRDEAEGDLAEAQEDRETIEAIMEELKNRFIA
jgi:hypothetical protein